MALYTINRGINKPLEFKGLKAQYIACLGIGLVALLILFSVIFICGVPAWLCITLVTVMGSGLFFLVYRLSHKYGQYGLMKKRAKRRIPKAVLFHSRSLFLTLKR